MKTDLSTGDVLRNELVRVALAWEDHFGVAPHITTVISELDAARLVGMTDEDYCVDCKPRTAVTKGHDFVYGGIRYQITANRPSGKKGSKVTLVGLKRTFEWDRLIWLLYDRHYVLQEAWMFTAEDYQNRFLTANGLSPSHMRSGACLWPVVKK